MTFTEKTATPEARKNFLGTIHALGHTLDMFARKGDAHLKEVVEAELAPFTAKVSISGIVTHSTGLPLCATRKSGPWERAGISPGFARTGPSFRWR